MQCTAKQGKHAPKDDSLPSSELVTEPSTDEAAEHGTEIVHCDQASLLSGVCDFTVRADADSLDVSRRAVHEAHDALIVALEDQGEGGEEIEHPKQDAAWDSTPWLEGHCQACKLGREKKGEQQGSINQTPIRIMGLQLLKRSFCLVLE